MKWNHIMEKQPQHNEAIIQMDRPYNCEPLYEKHYSMRMRKYYQDCSFDELLHFCKINDLRKPDFWWISAKEFPFPDKNI